VSLREAQDRPGDFDVLVHGDPCPDNCHWAGPRIRLLDFEHGRFGDAFTDGRYPRVPFPTCWCVGRLPPDTVEQAVEAYRRELTQGAPAAADPARFERGMLEGSIRWVWGTLVHWHMPGVLEKDGDWGLATLRQRLLLRFRLLLERLERARSSPSSRKRHDGRWTPSPAAGPTCPRCLLTRLSLRPRRLPNDTGDKRRSPSRWSRLSRRVTSLDVHRFRLEGRGLRPLHRLISLSV
jgi:hypothetical protein